MRPILSAVGLVLILSAAAPAADPVCALIDPGKSPRAALLEAKLLASPGATWVERADIEKVLKEQKLQAAFGAQGVGERVKLGRLLKADVLVMVREIKDAGEPAVEVVVSETGGGLRLLIRGAPATKDAAADAATLADAVRDGIRKYGEKINEVVAIPPFVTKDLELEHDHLKGAYARLAESAALGREGVVVVELEEARALAQEIAIAAPGMKIDRPPPVYLLGEYRNDGRGKDRTVTLNLKAERGGKPLGKPQTLTARPDAVPAGLRAWASGVLDSLATDNAPRPASDPKGEAKLLAERALAFRRLGYRTETLALAEASLLLNPDQPALHVEAHRHLCWQAGVAFYRASSQRDDQAAAAMSAPYLRALAHIEAYANTATALPDYGFTLSRMETELGNIGGGLKIFTQYRAALEEELVKLDAERRAVYLRIIPTLVRNADRREVAFAWAAFRNLPRKERYAAVEALVASLEELPRPSGRAVTYTCIDGHVPEDRPEYRELLARWAASEKAYLRSAAAELKARRERPNVVAPPVTPEPEANPNAPGPGAITLKPVPLDVPRTAGVLGGGMAIGPATDLLWTDGALFLMTEKGKPRAVWADPASDRQDWKRFSSVSFDGKYVWATCERSKFDPVLLVLDPATGKAWDANKAEGMPRPPARKGNESLNSVGMMACATEPGRACVAGSFAGRSWVGVAAFDAATEAITVKVTHEAREAADPEDKDQWKKTTVGFRPAYMNLLTGPAGAGGKPSKQVLLGRVGNAAFGLTEHPLVVRPDGAVEGVLADRMWNPPSPGTSVVVNGSFYYLEMYSEGQKIRTHLARTGLPGPAKQVLFGGMPQSPSASFRVTAHGGKFHAVIEFVKPVEQPRVFERTAEWWTADLDGKNPKQVATGLPGMRAVWASAHYGLVGLVDHGLNAPPVLNTVEFVASAPKKPADPVAVAPKTGTAPPKSTPAPKDFDPTRAPKAGEERSFEVAPGVKMVFCYVPAGSAQLGAPKAEREAVLKAIDDAREPGWLKAEAEEVRGVFKTKGFWLGKYEVTQAEWKAVTGEDPSHYNGKRPNSAKGLDTSRLPVDSVSWNACQKFLGAVNKQASAAAVFGRPGQFCLPHENEWEYACRGGRGNARAFYWGNEWNGTQANTHGFFPFGTDKKGPARGRPAPGGSYEKDWPHPWGLCDMHGNVWEWCDNEFDDVTNLRVLRGGAHSIFAVRGRAAARNRYEPFLYSSDIGFRVCFRPDE